MNRISCSLLTTILFFSSSFFSLKAISQVKLKTDVLVLGGSAAGTAAAIQATRSGVKAILLETGSFLIDKTEPNMNIPDFDSGIWAEWKKSYKLQSDSTKTDPRKTIEKIAKSVNGLKVFTKVEIQKIEDKKNSWEIRAMVDDKLTEITAKVLVDASSNLEESPLKKANLLNLNDSKKIDALVSFTKTQLNNPYKQVQKLYRTAVASGYGKDSTELIHIPLGIFIPKNKGNLLVLNRNAAIYGFDDASLNNNALWTSIGQAAGALAAFGPFFQTSLANANIRIIQAEVFTYKGQILPVKDVLVTDSAYVPIQKIIGCGILKLDFNTGNFKPDSLVMFGEIKTELSDLFPRSRIWFIENKTAKTNIENIVSLISFITGRETIEITREITENWKDKYLFKSAFASEKLMSRKEFAVIISEYLNPFTVRVDFNGLSLR